MTRTTASLALFALFAGAANHAAAQSSKMPGYLDKLVSTGQRMIDESKREVLDDRVILSLADQLADVCEAAGDEIKDFGSATLKAIPQSHRDRMLEPYKLAADLGVMLQKDMRPRCEKLKDLAEEEPKDRDDDWDKEVRWLLTGLGIACEPRRQDWIKLVNKNEEIRRWLAESLKSPLAMRTDLMRPGLAMAATRQKYEEQLDDHEEAQEGLIAAKNGAASRKRQAADDAFEAWNRFVELNAADPSPSQVAAVTDAFARWRKAEEVYRQACGAYFQALTKLEQSLAEGVKLMRDLAKVVEDFHRFQEKADPAALAERCAAFEIALQTFEAEMKG